MPHANEKYVRHYWHMVYMAMDEQRLDYKEMLLLTLGTKAAEMGNFNIVICEYDSPYSTSPNDRLMSHCFEILKLALGKNEDGVKIIFSDQF